MRYTLMLKADGKATFEHWQRLFAEYAPDVDVYWLDDESVDPSTVDFALVWEPDFGRLAQFPNLKVTFSGGAGVDHIIADPSYPKHVPIVRLFTEESAQLMLEFVTLAALMALKKMPEAIANSQRRHWDTYDLDRTAKQTTIGMMGLGNLGTVSARALGGLGFQLSGWSRTAKSLDGMNTYAGQQELGAFLAQTDILVCLLPQTEETRHIICAQTIAQLPQGAAIVNVGRGTHVNVPDLIQALDSGHLACAVLDVFDPEPLAADSPLWNHPKVIVTPHIAANPSRRSRVQYVAQQIQRHAKGQDLPHIFNHDLGY